MKKFKVFTYGSNMSSKRLKARCPSATFSSTARLNGYDLKFNKVSRKDGTGKGNIVKTGSNNNRVFGIIFEIDESDRESLDNVEGKGFGDNIEMIRVEDSTNHIIEVEAYVAKEAKYIDDNLKPLDWYKEHCVRGAAEFGLPEEYINFIKEFESITDKDVTRANNEMAIYK